MKIKILGNGGALNDGLPYNSFMVDDFFLAEAPPDIMNSFIREKCNLSKLNIIYISHFHGDHYFGLPFILLHMLFDSFSNRTEYKVTLLGPENLKSRTYEICRLALGDNHPVINWCEDNITFIELSPAENINIDNTDYLTIFKMNHFVETCGFNYYRNGRLHFSYFADTVWSDDLITQIKLFPELIIADLNGEPADPVKIHMSESDIIEKALPVSEGKISYYGTHLKMQKESVNKYIRYAHPGEIIHVRNSG